MADHHAQTDALGPNAWLVDEMYEQFLADPGSVSESWQDFFADYQRDLDVTATVVDKALPATGRTNETGQVAAVRADKAPSGATPVVGAKASAPAVPEKPKSTGISPDGSIEVPGEPLRGAAARIVINMEASLGVPTATSFREVPARLLEVNRRIINGYLGRTRGGRSAGSVRTARAHRG